MENIIIGLFFLLLAFLIFYQLRLFYNRYLRTYNSEIRDFLKKENFEFIETRFPQDDDWTESPFKKPKRFEGSLFLITINGLIVSWTRKDYQLIECKKGENRKIYWVEITTTYFKKPELIFRDGKSRKHHKANIQSLSGKVINVGNKCPACGFHLSSTDNICPGCGLCFS